MPTLTKRRLLSLAATTTVLTSVKAASARAVPSAGAPLVQAALNENPFGPSPRAKQALAAQLGQANRYGDAVKADNLVTQIAKLENISPEQVVLGDLLESLGLFLGAQKPEGGNFVYSAPGYTALVDAGKPAGAVGIGVPLDASLSNDLPALAKAVTDQTKAVYLVNPHNPSGTTNDPDGFEKFLSEVSQKTLVVVDEAYIEYAQTARSAVALTRAGANVAVFRTLDKVYGLAGLPIGYLLTPKPLANKLRSAGFGNPHALGGLAIAAASAALSDQNWVRTTRDRIAAGRKRLTDTLDALHLKHTKSEANFVFFQSAKPPQAVRDELKALGILIAHPFAPLTDWLRISVGTEEDVTRTILALKIVFK